MTISLPMKTFALTLVFAALTLSTSASEEPKQNPVNVVVLSESQSLATGYAEAFKQLSRPPLTLAFQKEGSLRVLEDVKNVRASGGVIIVEVGRGLIYVINAQDVVYLTDGPQVTKKP